MIGTNISGPIASIMHAKNTIDESVNHGSNNLFNFSYQSHLVYIKFKNEKDKVITKVRKHYFTNTKNKEYPTNIIINLAKDNTKNLESFFVYNNKRKKIVTSYEFGLNGLKELKEKYKIKKII